MLVAEYLKLAACQIFFPPFFDRNPLREFAVTGEGFWHP
jgi:hypothetical protein